jgi:hypothetical protein
LCVCHGDPWGTDTTGLTAVGEPDNKNASSDSMLSPKMCLVLSRFVLTARIHIFVGHLLCVVLTNQTAQNWTIINRAAIGGIRRLFILFFFYPTGFGAGFGRNRFEEIALSNTYCGRAYRIFLAPNKRGCIGGAQTAVFELDIRISNLLYIDVCQSLASETGRNSRNVEKRINAV